MAAQSILTRRKQLLHCAVAAKLAAWKANQYNSCYTGTAGLYATVSATFSNCKAGPTGAAMPANQWSQQLTNQHTAGRHQKAAVLQTVCSPECLAGKGRKYLKQQQQQWHRQQLQQQEHTTTDSSCDWDLSRSLLEQLGWKHLPCGTSPLSASPTFTPKLDECRWHKPRHDGGFKSLWAHQVACCTATHLLTGTPLVRTPLKQGRLTDWPSQRMVPRKTSVEAQLPALRCCRREVVAGLH